MISFHENFLLKLCAFNLIIVKNDIFSKRFHGVYFLWTLLLDKEYFTKTSSADNLLDNEVLESDLIITFSSIQGLWCVSEASLGIIVLPEFLSWPTKYRAWRCVYTSSPLLSKVLRRRCGRACDRLSILCSCWFINVFTPNTVCIIWLILIAGFHILLRSWVFLQLLCSNTINRKVLIHYVKEDFLECMKEFLSSTVIRFKNYLTIRTQIYNHIQS